ncbi:Sensor protein DivL [Roseivivax sp. THAF40]|uniref:PAS-domain containing protein n=1 Tax=unclassified Roseivivax TaxID=2639302 RepID=UPI00126880E9|nr:MULTISPECIES: PAS-domain containing protein [unclassified Roseivivax]QFS84649.1 Sensor protein DivL [Roseivivax sp. THAF197b]QFT48476.1 Sensor protein DivL [Roseivivax sp. THAF40]
MALETWLAILIGIGLGSVLALLRHTAFPNLLDGLFKRTGTPDLEEPLFLVREARIVDATPAGKRLLGDRLGETWEDLRTALSPIFPGLPAAPPTRPLRLIAATADAPDLQLRPDGERLRIGLTGPPPKLSASLSALGELSQLSRLRRAAGLAPYPMWQTDPAGDILWSNEGFGKLAALAEDEVLFQVTVPDGKPVLRERVQITAHHPDLPEWFEVTSVRAANTWFHYAVDIDAVVEAETARRNFVQTLAKTFAHLPIGLAIFDRNRQLVLFNPALLDLTQLSVEFLSGRPNLMTFFDQLRENRVMPEPKSYDGWRQQLAELVAAATNDRYCETWSLPSGLTYRIAGRPHPDGAVAFLIEDISSEIALTRRFRAELNLCQSVIDTMGEAVATFSATGVLTFCNAGYRGLWGTDPDSTFADVTVVDATRLWQSSSEPCGVWAEVRSFVTSFGARTPWRQEVRLTDGRKLCVRCDPLPGSATLVRFNEMPSDAMEPAPPRTALVG